LDTENITMGSSTFGLSAQVDLRVLLAGHNTGDLQEAQNLLQGRGIEAIVTSSGSKVLNLLDSEHFDVVIVEVNSKRPLTGDAVDGLQLLTLKNAPPIAVALDFEDGPSMVKAVELGAVDILQTPVSKQQDRLATLWQHTLRRKCSSGLSDDSVFDMSASEHSTDSSLNHRWQGREAGYESGDALCKAMLPGVFESDSDSDGENDEPARSGNDSCAEERQHVSDSTSELHSACKKTGAAEHSRSAQCTADSHAPRDWASDALLERSHSITKALPQGYGGPCQLKRVFSVTETADCLTDDENNRKKQKVEWTLELHERFVKAVEILGPGKAVPSKIKEFMGECANGLTRQNIASHLQKYRNRKRTRTGLTCTSKAPTMAHLPPLLPAPVGGHMGGSAPMVAGMPFWPFPLQGAFMPPVGGGAWPCPMPMIPTPPAWFYPMTQQQSSQTDLHTAIDEVLKQRAGTLPLGLKLDARSVLSQLAANTGMKVEEV
jgi:SHAQKYF class myb-like DNA-binding protein